MRIRDFFHALVLAVSVLSALPSQATLVVAPGANATVEGNSDNCIPFSCGGAQHYQQLYDASLFGGLIGTVDRLRFRVEGGFGGFASSQFDMMVTLSNTAMSSTTMSTTFANNFGANSVVVLDGTVSLSGTGGATGTNPFDVILDVANLFTYDGVSNLLLDIDLRSGVAGPQFDSVKGPGVGIRRLYVPIYIPPLGPPVNLDDGGLVTAFDFAQTGQVPEPGSLMLGLIALGALGVARRNSAGIVKG